MPDRVQFLIVHHTATDRDTTTFEAVKKGHVDKGWGDIGYNYFINGKGEMIKGRNNLWIGAHTKADGMNFKSLAVCLAGNFEYQFPTEKQVETLNKLLDELRERYGVARNAVLGHQEVDGAATACPGKNLLPYVKSYRQEENMDEINELKKQIELLEHRIKELSKDNELKLNVLEDRDREIKRLKETLKNESSESREEIEKLLDRISNLEKRLANLPQEGGGSNMNEATKKTLLEIGRVAVFTVVPYLISYLTKLPKTEFTLIGL